MKWVWRGHYSCPRGMPCECWSYEGDTVLGSEKMRAQEQDPDHEQGGTCWCGERHGPLRPGLPFKIYNEGHFRAAVRHLIDAAILVGVSGGLVRHGHRGVILWREGAERFSAADSYDEAAALMEARYSDSMERTSQESPQL